MNTKTQLAEVQTELEALETRRGTLSLRRDQLQTELAAQVARPSTGKTYRTKTYAHNANIGAPGGKSRYAHNADGPKTEARLEAEAQAEAERAANIEEAQKRAALLIPQLTQPNQVLGKSNTR